MTLRIIEVGQYQIGTSGAASKSGALLFLSLLTKGYRIPGNKILVKPLRCQFNSLTDDSGTHLAGGQSSSSKRVTENRSVRTGVPGLIPAFECTASHCSSTESMP